jgi:hypothetical protein
VDDKWTRKAQFVRIFDVSCIPDGTYDVIVVDVETNDHGALRVEVVITLGPHVGQVVALLEKNVEKPRSGVADTDPHALLGIPGTLHIRDGKLRLRPETA